MLFCQCHSQLAAGQAATQRSQGDGDSPKPPNYSQLYPRADVKSLQWGSRGRSFLGAPGADPHGKGDPVPKENGHQPLGCSALEILQSQEQVELVLKM